MKNTLVSVLASGKNTFQNCSGVGSWCIYTPSAVPAGYIYLWPTLGYHAYTWLWPFLDFGENSRGHHSLHWRALTCGVPAMVLLKSEGLWSTLQYPHYRKKERSLHCSTNKSNLVGTRRWSQVSYLTALSSHSFVLSNRGVILRSQIVLRKEPDLTWTLLVQSSLHEIYFIWEVKPLKKFPFTKWPLS